MAALFRRYGEAEDELSVEVLEGIAADLSERTAGLAEIIAEIDRTGVVSAQTAQELDSVEAHVNACVSLLRQVLSTKRGDAD